MLIYRVGAFIHKPEGAKEQFDVRENLELEDFGELKLSAPVSARVQFLKLPHEINVQIADLQTKALAVCSRCLRSFTMDIALPLFFREFIIDLPEKDLEEGEDVSYVNKATNGIDLSGMIRDEIILHFPAIPLCSPHCKGLCDKCGANRNEKNCLCLSQESGRVKLLIK